MHDFVAQAGFLRNLVEDELAKLFTPRGLLTDADVPADLAETMRYALLGGGKRLRPVLCLASCQALCGDPFPALPAALAIEVLHNYTLVHDDLPCMDDDLIRRGRPTVHARYGYAEAVLVGDALQAAAFQLALLPPSGNTAPPLAPPPSGRSAPIHPPPSERGVARSAGGSTPCAAPNPRHQDDAPLREGGCREATGGSTPCTASTATQLALTRALAHAAGPAGVVGGQWVDVTGLPPHSSARIAYVHAHKTGDLIECAVRMGSIAAGASPDIQREMADFGRSLGQAFQIIDDLLDAGDPAKSEELSILRVETPQAARSRARAATERALGTLKTVERHVADTGRDALVLLRALARDQLSRSL